jgi:hypothetical protein
MIRLFITKAAPKAVSFEDKVFMLVSWRERLSSFLTLRTQQGPYQLQTWIAFAFRAADKADTCSDGHG